MEDYSVSKEDIIFYKKARGYPLMHAKQEKTHKSDTDKKVESTPKVAKTATDATRLPAWTNAWGNNPPAGLFLQATGIVPGLQAKLEVSQPNDPSEQEADRVAEQVMRMPDSAAHVQHKCACGGVTEARGECAECAAKRVALQRRSTYQASDNTAPSVVSEVLSNGGGRLDTATRSFMEPRFGHDFSDVRIHTDTRAAESAQSVNALAYTVGRDVVFGSGQYAPTTVTGQHLLAHELTHVVQQSTSPMATSSDYTRDNSLPSERANVSVQRQASSGPSASGTSSQPASSDEPDPRLSLQLPISIANFQIPIGPTGDNANVFVLPPLGQRNQNFDQIWQPNIAAGLNLSLHQSDTGIELGLFAQGGANFSLNLGDLPRNKSGSRRFLTGWNLQGYLQPAWVFFAKDKKDPSSLKPSQASIILQPGVGRTWSNIPGLQGNAATLQGGIQFTWNLTKGLQLTGAVLVGYNWTWVDQPPPDMKNPQENLFTGITIALQPVIPLVKWPTEPTSPSVPAPENTPKSPEQQPSEQPKQEQPQQEPQPGTSSGPPSTTPTTPPAESFPILEEIFFKFDKPSPQELSSADINGSLTPEGRSNLDSLIQLLQSKPNLRIELAGMASAEGNAEYNAALASRRLELVANALGSDSSRITSPPERDIKDVCDEERPGIYNCGSKLADKQPSARDRKVMVLIFTSSP